MYCYYKCSVALLHGAVGWSAVCDCGISWSYSLTFCRIAAQLYKPSAWDFQQCGMCDQQSLRSACAYAQSDQSLCWSFEFSMFVKLLTEHHLEFLSFKGGCTCSSESTLVKKPTLLELTCNGSIDFGTYRICANASNQRSHADISSRARNLNFGLILSQHPNCVYTSNEVFGICADLHGASLLHTVISTKISSDGSYTFNISLLIL